MDFLRCILNIHFINHIAYSSQYVMLILSISGAKRYEGEQFAFIAEYYRRRNQHILMDWLIISSKLKSIVLAVY